MDTRDLTRDLTRSPLLVDPTVNRPPVQPIRISRKARRLGRIIDAQRSRVEASLPLRQAVNCRAPSRDN